MKDGSLEINNLALKIVSATERSSKMASTLCQNGFKEYGFCEKAPNFV